MGSFMKGDVPGLEGDDAISQRYERARTWLLLELFANGFYGLSPAND